MSIKIRTVTRTAEHQETESVSCDVCGQVFPNASPEIGSEGTDWSDRAYEVRVTSVFSKTGESYPEGGSSTAQVWDVCPSCFDAVVVKALRESGASPRMVERDW